LRREDLTELHYIVRIENVRSIMERGLLCRRDAARFNPASVADEEVVRRRSVRKIPGGEPLQAYVNLYLCARNPMLFVRQDQHEGLCVLRVSSDVLDLPGTVIADGNAASDYTRFGTSPRGLDMIEAAAVLAEYWSDRNDDQATAWDKKRRKCAEVLVLRRVPPSYIHGAYVSGQRAQNALTSAGFQLPVVLDPYMFFQRGR